MVGRKGLPANNLRELIDWLKANPDKATAGTAGVGSPPHIFGVLFQQATGTRFQFVHYRGGAPAQQDLVAGQIDFAIADQPTSLPQSAPATSRSLPTPARAACRRCRMCRRWRRPACRAFTPRLERDLGAEGHAEPIVARLNAAFAEALADPVARERLAVLGPLRRAARPAFAGGAAALQKAEIEKWWPIIKAANVKGE